MAARKRPQEIGVLPVAEQMVIVSGIEAGKVPDQIPEIGSNAEVVDFADVDGDPHSMASPQDISCRKRA
jgi:hypothetical protein